MADDQREITSTKKITFGQTKQIQRVLEDGMKIDFDRLDLTSEGAQEILKSGDLIQKELREQAIALLKKYSIEDKRFGPAITEFELTVPMDYDPKTRLDTFAKNNKKKFYYYNDAITDKNYGNVSHTLVPGKKYKVSIHPILSTVTSEDCMTFLKKQNALFVGAQGNSLTWELHKEEFPKDKWTVSFDEKEKLWKDADGRHRVPYVGANSGGDFGFLLGDFEFEWGGAYCLLCFREVRKSSVEV